MSNPITDPRYPLATAALASGAAPKDIRNWIERGQVVGLDADTTRGGSGWRRFSALDILALAYVRRLVDYGLGVDWAAMIAGEWTAYRWLRTYKNTPLAVLAAEPPGRIAVVWRTTSGGWEARIVFTNLPSPADDLPITDAWLTIDIGAVARRVGTTLADLYDEPAE